MGWVCELCEVLSSAEEAILEAPRRLKQGGKR